MDTGTKRGSIGNSTIAMYIVIAYICSNSITWYWIAFCCKIMNERAKALQHLKTSCKMVFYWFLKTVMDGLKFFSKLVFKVEVVPSGEFHIHSITLGWIHVDLSCYNNDCDTIRNKPHIFASKHEKEAESNWPLECCFQRIPSWPSKFRFCIPTTEGTKTHFCHSAGTYD